MQTLRNYGLLWMIVLIFTLPASAQSARDVMRRKVDAVVTQAYAEAVAKFPCRLKTSGKAKMGRWKDVENCVNPAHDLVDWNVHATRLQEIRAEERVSREELTEAIEDALTAHALIFDQVFQVKEKEAAEALLPLSNSLLKFLPENSLTSLAVFDKKGELLGSFVGSYASERSGGLEVLTSYRMVNFQYTNLAGNVQAPTESFLLDSFGVPWRDARTQPGFRLPSDKLLPRR